MIWSIYVVLASLFLFAIWLADPTLINRPNDLRETVWPIALHWKQALLVEHTWPLWRPTLMGGMPFVADPQPFIPYPPNFLLLILPLSKASWLLYGLHLAVMGSGVYLLARTLNAARTQALLAGIIAMFAPTFIARIGSGHLNMMEAMSLAPWILVGVLSINRKRWWLVTILLLAAQIILYANIWYYTTLVVAVLLFASWRRSYQKLSDGVRFASALLLPLLLSAYLVLPVFAYARESTRASMTLSDLSVPTWSLKRFVLHLFMPVKDEILVTGSEAMIFPGISVLVLAFLGLRTVSRKVKLLLAVVVVCAILLALGQRTPLMQLLVSALPGYSLIRGTARFWFLVMIGLGLLASRVGRKVAIGGLLVALVELTGVGLWWLSSEPAQATALPAVEQYLASAPKPWRIYCTTLCWSQYTIALAGGEILGGNNPWQLSQSVDFMGRAAGYVFPAFSVIHPPYQIYGEKPQPSAKLLGDFAVEYVVSPYPLADAALTEIMRDKEYILYRNTMAHSRVYTDSLDYQTARYGVNDRVMATATPSSVTLAEWYVSGWKAELDGRPVPIERSAGGFIQVAPATSGELVFRFRPDSFIIGGMITLGGLLALALAYVRMQ